MRLNASQLVVVWIVGFLAAFGAYSFFGVWQENRLPGQIAAVAIVGVCLLLTAFRRRES
jgi:hypothetical protein